MIAYLKLGAAVVALAAAGAAGWTVASWRSSGQIAALEGEAATLRLAVAVRDRDVGGWRETIATLRGAAIHNESAILQLEAERNEVLERTRRLTAELAIARDEIRRQNAEAVALPLPAECQPKILTWAWRVVDAYP